MNLFNLQEEIVGLDSCHSGIDLAVDPAVRMPARDK